MKLRFKDRIALFNLAAAATVAGLVFLAVYGVVFRTAFHHLDQDLSAERLEVMASLAFRSDSIVIARVAEWEEREHRQKEANPTFLQLTDARGRLLFRSSNLVVDRFPFTAGLAQPRFINTDLQGQLIRLGQFPVKNEAGRITGQLSIGISRAESTAVLKNLRLTLLIAFPFTLIVLYLASSYAAARGIEPVQKLIRVAAAINEAPVKFRLPLPAHEDEIRQLAQAINDLLQRIENSFRREKQFTSDASHELRTPLTAIRGQLEILIRRPREAAQYEEKITQVIREADRMQLLLDRLLQLARLEAGSVKPEKQPVRLAAVIRTWEAKNQEPLADRQITLHLDVAPGAEVTADPTFLDILLGNLLDNALKYGATHGNIFCTWDEAARSLTIRDDGPGIPPEHRNHLFDRLYRGDTSRDSRIPGSGLGLSIVQKIAGLEHIGITVESEEGKGVAFTLRFP